jgi:predicted regulator of Ras-like GTPase activity (Roadblock/LC7/MglB family)
MGQGVFMRIEWRSSLVFKREALGCHVPHGMVLAKFSQPARKAGSQHEVKMFGFVKNWLYRLEEDQADACRFPQPQLIPPNPAVPSPSGLGSRTDNSIASYFKSDEAFAHVLELPFSSVYPQLPVELQSRVRLPVNGAAVVTVPLAVIFPQLARGSIKVTFNELREMVTEETFTSQTDCDDVVVDLPLPEILARLNLTTLPRRTQTVVEVPEEITSPFEGKGKGLNIYKPEPPPATAFIRKVEVTRAVPVFSNRNSITVVPPMPQPSATPAPPTAPANEAPIPMLRWDKPSSSEVMAKTASAMEQSTTILSVALAQLAQNWPLAVQQEITQMNLAGAALALPKDRVADALKTGKVVFSWKQLRSWLNSPVAALAFSTHDADLLELPLNVIAPLFLATQQATRSHRKMALDDNIPDLFSKQGQPLPLSPPAPAPGNGNGKVTLFRGNSPAQPPKAAEIFANDLHERTGKSRLVEDVRPGGSTDFFRRNAPNDVVAKAALLDGVVGALIMLADGLLVASHLPPNVNGDTLAAFLPQLFGRVSQVARELRMGELRNLSFTVGVTPWEMFKVGSVFFAVYGRTGQSLPTAELGLLAAELDRKPKSF